MSAVNKVKHFIRDLFRYPPYRAPDLSYNAYWHSRDIESGWLNSFQKQRADLLLRYLKAGDSILDIGCGDGKILAYLKEKMRLGPVVGIDSSGSALEKARQRGMVVVQADISKPDQIPKQDQFDFVILFEMLEHLPNSEELLGWAMNHARGAVVFSVPNTGFVFHRLRLLFGRFPLQWKAHPSEHVRFWTLRDMHWWLKQLGYKSEIAAYEGVQFLNRFWPSMFAAGLLVIIKKEN